eukprot:4278540-Prymnesium_polylepis.1
MHHKRRAVSSGWQPTRARYCAILRGRSQSDVRMAGNGGGSRPMVCGDRPEQRDATCDRVRAGTAQLGPWARTPYRKSAQTCCASSEVVSMPLRDAGRFVSGQLRPPSASCHTAHDVKRHGSLLQRL